MSERNRENIAAAFKQSKEQAIDIKEHLDFIKDFCSKKQIKTVLEYGTREGYSTTAYVAGGADRIDCVDIKHTDRMKGLAKSFPDVFRLHTCNSATFPVNMNYDLFFVDSLHTYQHVRDELKTLEFLPRYIMFHDTVLNGWLDETTNMGPGINPAIFEFMLKQPYQILVNRPFNNGLLVLELHINDPHR